MTPQQAGLNFDGMKHMLSTAVRGASYDVILQSLLDEARRLIGEQLPAFLRDYERVPEPLRRVERNGRTPDAQLVDGLRLIEQEIGDMTQRLAQADLDSLSTRGRFLEMKYREERAE